MAVIPLYVDGTRLRVDAPPDVADGLKTRLTFTEKRFLQGWEKTRAQNAGAPLVEEYSVQCYREDWKGRLCTDAGFTNQLKKYLAAHGHTPDVRYLWSADKTKWVFDWNRVNEYYPTLDKEQKQLLEMIIADRWQGGTANLPTGWGKGDIIGALVVGFKKLKIHVIVKGIATITQRLIPEFASKFVNFGVRGGGMKTNPHARVMLISADSMGAVPKDGVELVICDEARKLVTDSYMAQLVDYHHAIIWGLDATFDKRIDGKNYRRQQIFGDMRFRQGFQEAEKKGRVLPVVVLWNRFRMDIDPGAGAPNDVVYWRRAIWTNELRNQLIARVSRKYSKLGQMFVATATIEHLLNLRRLMPKGTPALYGTNMSDKDRQYYLSEGLLDEDEPPMDGEYIQKITRRFTKGKVQLALVNLLWNHGVSFNKLRHVFYASAMQSFESCNQVSGRLTRHDEGKKYGVLHEIFDTFSKKVKRWAMARYRVYRELGYTQMIWSETDKKFVRFYPS